ncbi:hypothetical protein PR202_gb16930 [Eleusine coracana subsp. coracana]|uniref:Uncharacterized protein n=1 Tax=Eleusine coracana subsp. coracana TaxID=191504 RepID=A0AAV5EZD2_ELECO|nr:hypothetical protein PR202_gb16930 [Eleusine coracana subsp. coracana]
MPSQPGSPAAPVVPAAPIIVGPSSYVATGGAVRLHLYLPGEVGGPNRHVTAESCDIDDEGESNDDDEDNDDQPCCYRIRP